MYYVNQEICIGCGICVPDCPTKDIFLSDCGKAEVKNKRCLECGHCLAICPVNAVDCATAQPGEVLPFDEQSFYIDPDKLMNKIKFTRSVRSFKDEKLDDALIEKLIEAGRYTPTGTNSQEIFYLVVRKDLSELKDIVYEGISRYADKIQAKSDADKRSRYLAIYKGLYKSYMRDKEKNDPIFFHAPVAVFVCSPEAVNASLAARSIELTAATMGLGACYLGFGVYGLSEMPEAMKAYGIPEGYLPQACLILGHPNVEYKRTVPRNPAQISWK